MLEYLIDNYCAEETFHEDMEKVVGRLKETFVYGAEAEKIRHYIRENRKHSVIANLEARLVETEDKYWGTISAINENFVNISENIVRQYPMILSTKNPLFMSLYSIGGDERKHGGTCSP